MTAVGLCRGSYVLSILEEWEPVLAQGTSDEVALLVAEFALLDGPISAFAEVVEKGEAAGSTRTSWRAWPWRSRTCACAWALGNARCFSCYHAGTWTAVTMDRQAAMLMAQKLGM